MMSGIKKLFFGVLIFLLAYGYTTIFLHDKLKPLPGYIKVGDFKKAYLLAKSTTLFDNYNYSKLSNWVLSYYYMFGIGNIVNQNFDTAEIYCLYAKEKCNIYYLYKEAESYYCQDGTIESFGYKNNNSKNNNSSKCEYVKKRLKELNRSSEVNHKIPYYWLPRGY